jgi:hypothetical protein
VLRNGESTIDKRALELLVSAKIAPLTIDKNLLKRAVSRSIVDAVPITRYSGDSEIKKKIVKLQIQTILN